jgi:hypothetical protein
MTDPTIPGYLTSILKSMSDGLAGGAASDPTMATADLVTPNDSVEVPPEAAPVVVESATTDQEGLAAFMQALGATESGHNPNARNARTGAAGTFQILPSNYPSWAKEAGVDPGDRSAGAQHKVASFKMQQYFNQFGSWEAVAVAWYAGPGTVAAWQKNPNAPRFTRKQGKGNEPSIAEYVSMVTNRMGKK